MLLFLISIVDVTLIHILTSIFSCTLKKVLICLVCCGPFSLLLLSLPSSFTPSFLPPFLPPSFQFPLPSFFLFFHPPSLPPSSFILLPTTPPLHRSEKSRPAKWALGQAEEFQFTCTAHARFNSTGPFGHPSPRRGLTACRGLTRICDNFYSDDFAD